MNENAMRLPPFRDVTVGGLLSSLADALPDHEALVYSHDGLRWSFRELEEEARRIACGLIGRGVGPGDRVAVWATNVPEWIVLQFALAKIGAILVTVNTSLRAREVAYLLRQSESSTLVTIRGFKGVDYLEELRAGGIIGSNRSAGFPHLARVIFIGEDCPAGLAPYAELRTAGAAVGGTEVDRLESAVGLDDVINMQYTSGTTGFPKGVMLSSRNIVNNGYWLGRGLAYTPADRLCLCVPLFHCFGCVIGVLGAYTHGACLCPVESFDPRRVLETIERERCTALYGVPTMFLAELEDPAFDRFDLRSLRTGIMAGALCPEPLMRRVIETMHLPEMTIAYGLTETSPGLTQTPRDASLEQRTQTVGRVLPETEIRIVDPATGEEAAVGAKGELWARGYAVMKGYYSMPEQTAAAITQDGWLRSGDQALIDAAGNVRITGRVKDMIIRGGENIAPKEIEDVLRGHPAVADVSVYGVRSDFFGEEVAAAVRLRPGASIDASAIAGFCSGRLARFKVPRYVRFVDGFPMTASGKIQKFRLREAHERELETAPRQPDTPGAPS
ncbi:MAG TPA: AMP-binding protein [Vicinamibacterales bacterium]|nr:AMP-binding protein [Vicinamibacterales bacterium]